MPVLPSFKMQDVALLKAERCGRLKWDHGMEVLIGGKGKASMGYDYALPEVRAYKLALIREVLEEYRPDGIELDFVFTNTGFFKEGMEDKNIRIMNAFVAEIRKTAEEVGKAQGRQFKIMARTHHAREANFEHSIDIETWLREKSIDYIVGEIEGVCMEPYTPGLEWISRAANDAGGAAYIRPPRRVYDERTNYPAIEMVHALSQTLRYQGFAGMYLGYLPWPLADEEYRVLREAAYPEIFARRDNIYFLAPREGEMGKPSTTPYRKLPQTLDEGETFSAEIFIADDVGKAKEDEEMREPVLTLRFESFCIEDDFTVRVNGMDLPRKQAEITHYRGLKFKSYFPGPIQAPLGFEAHWLKYRLPVELVRQGKNSVEVTITKKSKIATFRRGINGVEIPMFYRDFERPLGLGVERIQAQG